MDPIALIQKYYDLNSPAYAILLNHSQAVTQKSLLIARAHPEWKLDRLFMEEAGMLHDIGIFMTNAPSIGCFGTHQYIEHGYLGADLLRSEGFPRHALVCERHTGVGLSKREIIEKQLPLPHRDMIPVSMEEQIICFADKFFSKSRPGMELTIDEVRRSLSKFGDNVVNRFDEWTALFLSPNVGELISKPKAE
ncbi:MAG: HDIG domain-containing metalloprotein [Microbacter sp.]